MKEGIFMLGIIILIYSILIYFYRNRFISADKRIAVNNLPFPVYFGLGDSIPFVVNNKMYELMYDICGKPLNDIAGDFDCLYDSRLNTSGIEQELSEHYNNAFFLSHNDRILCVEEKSYSGSGEKSTLIYGHDITDEYEKLCRLKELNGKLKMQNQRLKYYIKDSVNINHSQELLSARMKVHSKFGECITMTRYLLRNPEDTMMLQKLPVLWHNAVISDDMKTGDKENSQYEELIRVSEMIGCKVIMDEELPQDEMTPLLLKVIREALNNAIRHGNATSLNIILKDYEKEGKVIIFDDGKPVKPFTGLGGGLSSLRTVLEQNGVLMNIETEPFTIVLKAPNKGNKRE